MHLSETLPQVPPQGPSSAMASAPPTLHCPNPRCQAQNLGHAEICQKCQTPLVRRYLWLLGESSRTLAVGQLLGDRYWTLGDRVLLDTKPAALPQMQEPIPQALLPYSRLFPYRLAVPQLYDQIRYQGQTLTLLEDAPLYPDAATDAIGVNKPEINKPEINKPETNKPETNKPETNKPETNKPETNKPAGRLLPTLAAAWVGASPQRQINWLWQMAELCAPLRHEGVAATLLQPELLRVDGSVLRLLELHQSAFGFDLTQLGQLWLSYASTAHASIATFLASLAEKLYRGEIATLEPLLTLFEQVVAVVGKSQTYELHLATCSDSGPHRTNNEDLCLPPAGTFRLTQPQLTGSSLVLVCDGLGGHDGGEVAAQLAVETLQQHLHTAGTAILADPLTTLERALYAANDEICDRNDQERRKQRQRMATTVVLAHALEHLIYLAHVGDSRIYRLTHTSCRQVTVDDDMASNHVCLGDSLYRYAIRQPGSGALLQALGMNESTTLTPRIQRFLVDEDAVLVLCSDGLSDYDRLDAFWPQTLRQVLTNESNPAKAATELLQLANRHNGHDNVSIAVIHLRLLTQTPPDSQALCALLNNWSPFQEESRPGRSLARRLGHNGRVVRQSLGDRLDEVTPKPQERSPRSPLRLFLLTATGLGFLGLMVGYGIKQQLTLPQSSPIQAPLERLN